MKDELVKAKINGLGQIAHVFGIPNTTGLLFVHGGPGNPNRHKIKDKLSPLFDKFLVCAYDQRGTGGSYHAFPKKADYSIESYVEDILTWGRLIKRRYSLEKIILVGESWGSAISVLSLAKSNGLFNAYLGYGQFVSSRESVIWQYEELSKRVDVAKAGLKRPIGGVFETKEQEALFHSLLYPAFEPKDYPSYKEREVIPFNKSKEYSLWAKRGWRKGTKLLERLCLPLSAISLPREFDNPFFICQGKDDFITPYPVAKAYFEDIKAPRKGFYPFDCGHLPAFEKPMEFCDLLIRLFS